MTGSSDYKFNIFTEVYGSDKYQAGDLYIPERAIRGCICLFHGGFWKMPYDRFQMSDVAERLAETGFVVWNIEYRRIGYPGGGYPGTFDDAVNAINFLIKLKEKFKELILIPLYLAGHSAGGHLALWLGKKDNRITKNKLMLHPDALIGLAPIVDLKESYLRNDGNGAVFELLQGSPENSIERYSSVSPAELLPLNIDQLIIHGTGDEVLPISGIENYVSLARRKGDKIDFIKINNGGHMDFVDAESEATTNLVKWLLNHLNKS